MKNLREIEPPLDLRQYLAVLRARKWTIALVAGVMVVVALVWSLRQTPVYRAQARLLVQPIESVDYAAPPNLETESQVVRSVPVAQLVKDDLDVTMSAKALLGGLDVQVLSETEVLLLGYTSADRDFAARAANSFAESYILYKKQQAAIELQEAKRGVEGEIGQINRRLVQVNNDLARARRSRDDGRARLLETERAALLSRAQQLQQRLDSIAADESIKLGAGQVIEAASVPASPASPRHLRNGLFGAFFGLLAGAGVALARERLGDRFRGREDVERALEAPVLAAIPRFRKPKQDAPAALVVARDPRGAASEAYRSLRTRIQLALAQSGAKSVLITSPAAGEGKTVTCANVGLALAQAGAQVILLSGDLRRPTLERYFKLDSNKRDSNKGLSGWLKRPEQRRILIEQAADSPNLKVLTTGPVPPNPDELLSSPRLRQLIKTLEQNADVVLVDSPPTLGLADTSILASHVGGTLLVLDVKATPKSQAVHAGEELERVGTKIVGTVLNAFDPSTSAYYYDYAAYGYLRYETTPSGGDGQSNGRSPGSSHEATQQRKKGLFGRRR